MRGQDSFDVACYGELLWDFFEAEPRVEKEPLARTFKRELGGASANVAVVLARVGLRSAVIGGVGDDKLGDALEAALEAEDVDTSGVARVKRARTGITLVARDPTGAATFMPYRDADLGFGEAQVGASTAKAAKAKWLVVSSTSLLPRARGATEKLLAAAEKNKAFVLVDLNARAHLWEDDGALRVACAELAKRATLVKASERDLGAVAGKRGMSWLEENAKQASWILTRGENGAAAVGVHGQVTAPTKRVRCVDATGAGDALVAGVLAVLLRAGAKPGSAEWKDGKLWTRALEIGHALAAKAVSAVGATAGVLQLDDIKARIEAAKKG
jgi:fructokinase